MPATRPSRVVKRLLALLLTAPAVLIASPSPAEACSCVGSTVEQRAPVTDAIFQGEVIDIDSLASDNRQRTRFTFAVARVWKGDVGSTVTVDSIGSGAACGLEIESGQTRVIYADERQGRLTSGLCSAPFGSGGKAALTALLGEPSVPDSSTTPPVGPPWSAAIRLLLSWFRLG